MKRRILAKTVLSDLDNWLTRGNKDPLRAVAVVSSTRRPVEDVDKNIKSQTFRGL